MKLVETRDAFATTHTRQISSLLLSHFSRGKNKPQQIEFMLFRRIPISISRKENPKFIEMDVEWIHIRSKLDNMNDTCLRLQAFIFLHLAIDKIGTTAKEMNTAWTSASRREKDKGQENKQQWVSCSLRLSWWKMWLRLRRSLTQFDRWATFKASHHL